jgi:hypothetical protein
MVFLEKLGHRSRYARESFDKAAVISCHSQKASNFTDVGRLLHFDIASTLEGSTSIPSAVKICPRKAIFSN